MMRKNVMTFSIWLLMYAAPVPIPALPFVQQTVPAYAKWGQLAMKEVQSEYPNATVVDYLHEGRETQGDTTTEKFKLWLRQGNHEFGVFVRITFNTETEQIVTIKFQETPR
ncbi:YqzG/YhdC family protein [Sporosarcina sp. FSL K6-1522]|uniref:YqzG/YhdC family protein n=1 Tax=Sporosarcina sp. FSL K6-1522 TaxID=2921554 RepID=UPI00315B3F2A